MNINIELLGEIILVTVIVVGILSYYLGKRKTQTPKIATFIGIVLSLIPPLCLIYLAVLVLKNDIDTPKKVAVE